MAKRHGNSLLHQARQIAAASAPSAHLINRQYNRSISDAGGFGAGLIAALNEASKQSAGAYTGALGQQQNVDAAAQDRLAGLGGAYGGAAVATGALGDSALGQLNASQAAAGNYQAQLPEVAAQRTRLGQESLANARADALLQRQDAIGKAVPGILNQLQTNRFDQSLALQNLGLSQARLQQQIAYESGSLQLRAAGLGQSQQQFAARMAAEYGYNVATGRFVQGSRRGDSTVIGLAHAYGLTPNEVITMQGHTTTQVEALLANGTNWKDAIARAEANGVPPPIARFAVMSVYSNPPKPPAPPAKPKAAEFADAAHYQQALAQWQQQYQSYKGNIRAYRSAITGFNVQVLWRQLQRRYDRVLHPPSSSSEH